MKVTKRVKLVSIKPAGEGLRYALLSSDGEWYSTFDSKVGKYIESVSEGDTVEIVYETNAKGFKNFSSIKLVGDDELPEEPPPEEEREEKSPVKQRRGIDRIDKNSISAASIAVELMELLDLSKMSEEKIVEKFKALWVLIKEEIEK